MFVRAPFRSDPPSVETVPASGELEVNLGEKVEMQCVTKGVPAPIISWRTKVIDIPGLFDIYHANDITRFEIRWWETFDGGGEGGERRKEKRTKRGCPSARFFLVGQ